MKQVKSYVNLLLVVLTILTSCTKNSMVENRNEQELYLSRIKQISNKYKSEAVSERLSDWTKHVIREDLNGAAIGAGLGMGGPHIIGAAAFGAGLFSLLALKPVYVEDGCGNLVCQNCSSALYANTANSLDAVGVHHNDIVSYGLANREYLLNNECEWIISAMVDSIAIFESERLGLSTPTFFDSIGISRQLLINELNYFNENYVPTDTSYSTNRLNYLMNEGYITSFVKECILDYSNALETLNTLEEIHDYTLELESILDESELPIATKNRLHAIYSVARHSCGAWINF